MGALTSRWGLVMAALESTYGDGEANGPDDALLLTEAPDIQPVQTPVQRETYKSSQGGVASASLDSHVEYSFEVRVGELPDEDGAAPSIGPLLVGAGFEETTSGTSTSGDLEATYNLLTTGHGSLELHHFLMDRDTGDTSEHAFVGARHNPEFTLSVENDMLVSVDGQGLYTERPAFADNMLADTIGGGVSPFKVVAITLTIDGDTFHCTELTFSPNWSVERDDSLASDALGQEVYLDKSDRAGGSIDPKAFASHYDADDFADKLRDADEMTVQAVVAGESSTLTIDLPAIQAVGHSLDADGSTYRHSIDYECNETDLGEDDDVTLTWAQT